MLDLWDVVKNVDFAGKLKPVLDAVEATDPRFVAVLVIILVYIGSKVSSSQPAIRALGLRLAAAAILLFGGYAYYETMEAESRDYLTIILRSFNAGGIVLATTWIMLPILNFVYVHLRLALAAFLIYGAYALVTGGPFDPDKLPIIAAKATAVVALTLVVAWILHPVWDFLKDLLPQSAPKPAPLAPTPTPDTMPAPVMAPAAIISAAPPSRTVPVGRRTQLRLDEVPMPAPQPALSPALLETQRRRDKIRLKIELAYVMAMPAISQRLPRPVFDDFVHRYLGDQLPPEDVEENGRQLEMILHEHQQQAALDAHNLMISPKNSQVPASTDVHAVEEIVRRMLDEQKRQHSHGHHKTSVKDLLEN